jgi:2-methylisocitrate lyase-like PEP mutase family enzyme
MSAHPGAVLRALLTTPQIAVLPGVHDALSARIAAHTGFTALVAGGNAATGTLLAEPDMGQLGMRDRAEHYRRIAEAARIPVLVDADTGFGGVHNVVQTVRAFERAGVAGLFMEDQVTPKRCGYLAGKQVVPVAEQVAKLRAALDARRDADFVICARTDAFAVEGIDAAIDRARAYHDTGVDMLFVQGADNEATLRHVCEALPGLHLANVSQAGAGTILSASDAQAAGAAAIMFPITALLAAAAAMERVFEALRNDGAVTHIAPDLMPVRRYNDITELARLQADEERYQKSA